MNAWEKPTSLVIGGVGFSIRTDFRAILDILKYYNDPDYEDDEKVLICLQILYRDFDSIPPERYEEALEKAVEFIDAGIEDDGKSKPRLMDWEQDAALLLPPINKQLGYDCRDIENLHWWTFIGAYMEIGESLFSEVLHIRSKKAKGKRLEKYEQEFYRENKHLIDIKTKLSEEEEAEKARLNSLI